MFSDPNPYTTIPDEGISYIFDLSNVKNGQKFKKLLSLNEAQENLWAINGPIGVKLLSPFHHFDITTITPLTTLVILVTSTQHAHLTG